MAGEGHGEFAATTAFLDDRGFLDAGIPRGSFLGGLGYAAVAVWLALQLDDWMVEKWPAESGRRLLLCALIVAPFFLASTSDLKGRFTRGLAEPYVDASDPALKGWMPEGDGIFYSADMAFFYDTFYHNPTGNWRYILGFEPALMPDEDLKILRTMQWNHWNWPTYDPSIKKMPASRLEIPSSMQPDTGTGMALRGDGHLDWPQAGGGELRTWMSLILLAPGGISWNPFGQYELAPRFPGLATMNLCSTSDIPARSARVPARRVRRPAGQGCDSRFRSAGQPGPGQASRLCYPIEMLALLSAVLLICCALPISAAAPDAAAQPPAGAISPEQLSQSIDQVLQKSEFAWRMPRKAGRVRHPEKLAGPACFRPSRT